MSPAAASCIGRPVASTPSVPTTRPATIQPIGAQHAHRWETRAPDRASAGTTANSSGQASACRTGCGRAPRCKAARRRFASTRKTAQRRRRGEAPPAASRREKPIGNHPDEKRRNHRRQRRRPVGQADLLAGEPERSQPGSHVTYHAPQMKYSRNIITDSLRRTVVGMGGF